MSPPFLSELEKYYIQEALTSNWISSFGKNIEEFEKSLSYYLHNYYVALVNSGTSAIHLALNLLDVNRGDEVLCQSFTFVASAYPIIYLGATPIFIDSESDTLNIDPNILEYVISTRIKKGKKPKAIICVHSYGMPAKMEEIINISKKYDIPVIEDAAEALGSTIKGKKCSTFGDIGILSFNGNKIITTGSGGAIISKNKNLIQKARYLSNQARSETIYYEHSEVGYNYRINNILAGIGRGQLIRIEEIVKVRRQNFLKYVSYFESLKNKGYNVKWIDEPDDFYSNRWLSVIIINPIENKSLSKDILYYNLKNENIESRPLWKPMHLQPVFKDYPYYGGKVAEEAFLNGICLPSGTNMSDEDWNRIFSTLDKIFV